jgi:uncharacterized protein with HEPN domain
MTVKDDSFYLVLILERIADIERYVGNRKERFFEDDMARNAAIHQLQTMAESTQRLSEATKAKAPEIPWKAIADFRNVLVHNYDGRINFGAVWTTIERDLPMLKSIVTRLLNEMGSGA